MKIITEFKRKNKSCYRVQEIIEGQIIIDEIVDIEQYSTIIDKKRYFILYYTDRTFDENIFNYINDESRFNSLNTRLRCISSLKYLMAWEDIIKKKFTEFTRDDAKQFLFFLYENNGTRKITKVKKSSTREVMFSC